MKKIARTKLALTTEVVRNLSTADLNRVNGGLGFVATSGQPKSAQCTASGTSTDSAACAPTGDCTSGNCQQG